MKSVFKWIRKNRMIVIILGALGLYAYSTNSKIKAGKNV